MRTVVDLTDIDIYLDSGTQNLRSPGMALLQPGKDPVLGETALHQSRLSPARIANRFWRDLSLNQVGISHSGVRHQADLVWHHLKALHREINLDQAIFICPAHYSEEHLGLLSGILQSLDIELADLASRPLICAASRGEPAPTVLELQLHQMMLSSIDTGDEFIIVKESRAVPGDGYLGIVDKMLKAIQKIFIRDTRFDPLHHASTEQQLFDALPGMLEHLARVDTTLALVQSKDEEYRVEIQRDDLSSATKSTWSAVNDLIASNTAPRIIADRRFATLPGVQTLQADIEFVDSPELVAQVRAMSEFDAVKDSAGSSPLYVQQLRNVSSGPPANDAGDLENRQAAAASQTLPDSFKDESREATHLLCRGVAYGGLSLWIYGSDSNRLEITELEPKTPLAKVVLVKSRLQIEQPANLEINGERLAGSRVLQISDVISHPEYSGSISAIQVRRNGS